MWQPRQQCAQHLQYCLAHRKCPNHVEWKNSQLQNSSGPQLKMCFFSRSDTWRFLFYSCIFAHFGLGICHYCPLKIISQETLKLHTVFQEEFAFDPGFTPGLQSLGHNLSLFEIPPRWYELEFAPKAYLVDAAFTRSSAHPSSPFVHQHCCPQRARRWLSPGSPLFSGHNS